MRIAVVGAGYVGLVTSACFADLGNNVWCVDVDGEKINSLKQGNIPIYEPGLKELVDETLETGNLQFTTNIREAIEATTICFIAVGTPPCEDGSADLQHVLAVAREIGQAMRHHMYIVDKSTVPVGTAQLVRNQVQSELDQRGSDLTFDVISNPEFLKEGTAVGDCSRPDRIIIGTDNDGAAKVMRELYKHHVLNNDNFIFMDIASAEMTKYVANAMLATKISFMNEIANICERIGADVNKVRLGIGSDTRIGYHFIYAGCGYGGSCFPKDIQALINSSRSVGYEPQMLHAVDDVNNRQKLVLSNKVCKKFGDDLSGKTFAVWGLSFKPSTDDMREAASITVINELTKRGAKILAYDPKSAENARKFYLKGNSSVEYVKSKYTALVGVDALILITEWKEFRSPDFEEMKNRMKCPVIFDGRNQYNPVSMKEMGFEYHQIGVGNV